MAEEFRRKLMLQNQYDVIPARNAKSYLENQPSRTERISSLTVSSDTSLSGSSANNTIIEINSSDDDGDDVEVVSTRKLNDATLKKMKNTLSSARKFIINSDSDEENATIMPPPSKSSLYPDVAKISQPLRPYNSVPTVNTLDRPQEAHQTGYQWQSFSQETESYLRDPYRTAEQTEQDLQELVSQTFAETEKEVDLTMNVVKGFQDNIRLLPHQIVGRAWMTERESDKKVGGILADDMGLGKTIQTLTRIVDGRPTKDDRASGFSATTLIVCPVALVGQWASEVEKMTIGLRVIEHHGPNRTKDPEVLKRAHIVITTYSTAASEYAFFDPEAAATKSKTKSKKASIKDDDDSFGSSVKKTGSRASKKKVTDALFHVKWWRIVLDEAHNIKNRNTKSAIACTELEAKYRWCLTGTPLQNNVEELYSLLKFLRIRPLSDWEEFNNKINKPVKSGRSVTAMKRLQIVLKAIMLRRQKNTIINGKPLLDLPDRIVEVVPCDFDEDERTFYTALETKMKEKIEDLMENEQIMNSYTSVLVLLLRLRQACDHPSLVTKDFSVDNEAVEPTAANNGNDLNDGDELADLFGKLGVSSKKCHLCQTTLDKNNANSPDATHCRKCAGLASSALRKYDVNSKLSLPRDSAKIRKILKLLKEIEEKSEGEEKTIVFSQFTTMLNLLEPFLKNAGIKFVRYDGSMNKQQRDTSLEKIRNDKSIKCILISFKAGSTGLNLTACNNVILVDLWWNPALEDQAFDRAHRFGQTRQVNIYKLTIEETVEERILDLQNKKRLLAAAALSGDKIKNTKLGMDDILALFRFNHVEE